MKRYLKKDRHQLNDWERENTWRAIETETVGRRAVHGPTRRAFRPALGLVSAAAVLVVCFAWYFGTSDSEKGFGSGSPGVVVLPPEMKVEGAGDRDPAADLRSTQEREIQEQLQETVLAKEEFTEETETPVTEPAETVSVAMAPTSEAKNRAAKTSVPEPVPAYVAIRGRVQDAETGADLDYATVLIRGTNQEAMTLGGGHFQFAGLECGRHVELQFMYTGYEPQQFAVTVPDTGSVNLTIRLKATIADTLQAFDIEAEKYVVEIKSTVSERPIKREVIEKSVGGTVTTRRNMATQDIKKVEKVGEVDEFEEFAVLAKERGHGVCQFVDEDGDGFNDLAPDANGNGIPNGLDADYVKAEDGSALEYTWGDSDEVLGSVTGGTAPPNGKRFELMYFDHAGVNPFIATEDDALSTFALDVDNASWTVARNYLKRGVLPPKDAIRVEEFVNAFDAGWPTHRGDAFRIRTDGSSSRFGDGYHLLRVGVVGRTVDPERRKAANLVFVIDISGSMDRENRLGLVKKALRVLLDELQEGDRVGIVVYGSEGRVVLEPTDIGRRGVIARAIDRLRPGGSTNAFEGLELAYDMARRSYEPAQINRLILCSDGVANHGVSTRAEEMLKRIRRSSDEGITLSTVGFGMGNYNDVLMEKLADQGDGNYYYVDELKEAERVFHENLTGLLQTIAREVKVQVEFDEDLVDRWRLLGYENRDVADRDFRNDAVDAGEVGSGHQVTALYEIKLADRPERTSVSVFPDDGEDELTVQHASPRLGTVRLRHEAPTHDTTHAGEVKEIESPILLDSVTGDFADASVWLRTQAVVAEFAEMLRGSYWSKENRLADLVPLADGLSDTMPGDEQIRELAELIRIAADLEAAEEAKKDPPPRMRREQ